jgi:hypothetical protein
MRFWQEARISMSNSARPLVRVRLSYSPSVNTFLPVIRSNVHHTQPSVSRLPYNSSLRRGQCLYFYFRVSRIIPNHSDKPLQPFESTLSISFRDESLLDSSRGPPPRACC